MCLKFGVVLFPLHLELIFLIPSFICSSAMCFGNSLLMRFFLMFLLCSESEIVLETDIGLARYF